MSTRTHVLKTLPRYWHALADGSKTFEVRRDDRSFMEGDTLVLRLYDPVNKDRWCSGLPAHGRRCEHWRHHDHDDESLTYSVTYIMPGGLFGIEPDYVIMGLGPKRCGKCRAECVASDQDDHYCIECAACSGEVVE